MINVDMKRKKAPRNMARRIHSKEELEFLQQIRRDLVNPWDEAETSTLFCSLGLIVVVLLVVHHFIGV